MNINNFLKKDLFLVDKSYLTKEDALKDFAKILENKGYAKDADKVLEKAIERENQFSTGIGSKIAIPHIRDDVMNESVILFAKVKPMDWKSLDNQNVEVIFFIAMNISEGENSHLEVISNLSSLFMDEKFINNLLGVNKFNELIDLLNKNLNSQNEDTTKTDDNNSYDIVAVTACPTGIAHTFMAAKKLEDVAKEMGVKIKVETQGTEGPRNVLKQDEIDNAKGVILACDKIVDTSRFAGHDNVLEISTKAAIKDAKKEINRSLNKEGVKLKGSKSNKSNFDETDNLISFDKFGKRLYKSLMTGVSYMLPFVVFGGILIALAFLIDIKHANDIANAPNLGSIEPAAKWFKKLGDISFGLMVPILGAYIAYALVGKMGLLPGFVCSQIAAGSYIFKLNPADGTVDWLADSTGGSVSGVFGAIIGGIYSGVLLILLIKYVFNYLPQQLNGIKNILFIPLFGTLLIAASFWVINIPLIYVNYGFTKLLQLIESNNLSVLLGLLIGTMMAVDLGGPINKAAYVVATLSLKNTDAAGHGTIAMASAMAGGMVPPLGIAFSCTFFKKMWTKEQRVAGYSNYIMGLSFISEGAIPFTTENPKLLVPANVSSGFVAGLLTAAFGIKLNAPHGGIFVFPLVSTDFYGLINDAGAKVGIGIALYLAAIIIGALTSMTVLFILYKVYKKNENKPSRKTKYSINKKNKNNTEVAAN